MLEPERISAAVYRAVLDMHVRLPRDVGTRLEECARTETGVGRRVLEHILRNVRLAGEQALPMCQDTGLMWVFLQVGEELSLHGLKGSVSQGIAEAYRDGYFRASIVQDPLSRRLNTGTNLPAVFHLDLVPGRKLQIDLLAKGFGSENCSRTAMLQPTAERAEVIEAICAVMRQARGAPCPPVVLGVGLGGTMDYAALLSKRALTRSLADHHPNPYYAELERDACAAINALGIGAGGLGGSCTALGVAIETCATHIAGMPLAVSVNCWADRRARIVLEEET